MKHQEELIKNLLQDIENNSASLSHVQSLHTAARAHLEMANLKMADLAASQSEILERLSAIKEAGAPFFTDEKVKEAAAKFSELFSSLASDAKSALEPKMREAAEKLNDAINSVDLGDISRKAREKATPFFTSVVDAAKRGAKQVTEQVKEETRDISVSRTVNQALEDTEQGLRSLRNAFNSFIDKKNAKAESSKKQGNNETWSADEGVHDHFRVKTSGVVGCWLNDYRADDQAQLLVSQAHMDYAHFCKRNNYPALTQGDFLKLLSELDILIRTVEVAEGEEVQVVGLRIKG